MENEPIALETININDPPDNGPLIDLSAHPGAVTPTPQVAELRSTKASIGVGQLTNTSKDDILRELMNGEEIPFRQRAASAVDLDKTLKRTKSIQDISSMLGKSPDMDAYIKDRLSETQALTQTEIKTDPNSVIEETYAKKYVGALGDFSDPFVQKSFMADAMNTIPGEVRQFIKNGQEAGSKREYAEKELERIRGIYDNQSWITWGQDQALNNAPFYQQLMLRDRNSWKDYFKDLLGTNMANQVDDLYSGSFKDFKIGLTAKLDDLAKHNPTLAMVFAHAMLGQTQDEKNQLDLISLLDFTVLGTPLLGKVSRTGSKRLDHGFMEDLGGPGPKGPDNLRGQTIQAATDVTTSMKEVGTPGAPPISVISANAIGNSPEAAVKRSSTWSLDNIRGITDDNRKMAEKLTDGLRLDKTVVNDKGSTDLDLANRIDEKRTAHLGMYTEAVINGQRVNRLGLALNDENVNRVIKEDIQGRFRGAPNSLVKIGDPKFDIANTVYREGWFGDYNGKPFRSSEAARNFAEHDLNLAIERPETTLRKMALEEHQDIVGRTEGLKTIIANRKLAGPVKAPPKVKEGYTRFYTAQDPATGKVDLSAAKPKGTKKNDYLWYMDLSVNHPYVRSIRGAPEKLKSGATVTPFRESSAPAKLIRNLQPFSGEFKHKAQIDKLKKQIETNEAITSQAWKLGPDLTVPKKDGSEVVPVSGPGHTVEQNGLGFYVKGIFRYPEESPVIQNALIKEGSKSPYIDKETKWNTLLSYVGKYRTGKETLPKPDIAARDIATVGPNVLYDVAKKSLKDLLKIPKTYREDFLRVLQQAQSEFNPELGRPGKFYETPGQLDGAYQQILGRHASEAEHLAYQSFLVFNEQRESLLNLIKFRNRGIKGHETHQLSVMNSEGFPVKSDKFDGRILYTFPEGNIDSALDLRNGPGTERIYYNNLPSSSSSTSLSVKESIKKGFDEGKLRIIELADPKERPLKGFLGVGDQRIRHIVVPVEQVTSYPLRFDQIKKVGGGPYDFKAEHFLAQADVRPETYGLNGKNVRHNYEGDVTISAVKSKAEGRLLERNMNEVRKLISEGKEVEARTFADKNKIPFQWDDHLGWYKESIHPNTGERVRPALNVNEPIRLVSRFHRVADVDLDLKSRHKNFIDRTGKDFLFESPDTQELYSNGSKGTRSNPMWEYDPNTRIDPAAMVNRSMSNIIGSLFMDDYKKTAMDHWLQEAKPYLNVLPGVWKGSPYWIFHNADGLYVKNIPRNVFKVLEANRRKIQDFIGMPSELEKDLNYYSQQLSESLDPGSKFQRLNDAALARSKDPIRVAKTIATHEKLGLGNILQIWNQGASVVNIASMSPRSSLAATGATLFDAFARWNLHPTVLNHFDNIMSTVHVPGFRRFKPGEWLEARQGFIDSGSHIVAGEHAFSDSPLSTPIVKTGLRKGLDMGMTPFRLGNQWVRGGAWYTAYLEHREVNPIGPISRQGWSDILARATILDTNMTRASNSDLHTGVMSLGTHFYTYQLRQFELMWGKQITKAERYRLIGANMLLYGIPVGIAGAALVPISDLIRRKALEAGYIPGGNEKQLGDAGTLAATVAMEGVVSTAVAWANGGGDIKKGTYYNFSKVSVKGFETLSDALSGDKSFLSIVTGSPGGIIASNWESASGLGRVLMAMIKGDTSAYPFTFDEGVRALQDISTVNDWATFARAMATGNLYSKKGVLLQSDVSTGQALGMAVTGLTPQKIPDAYLLQRSEHVQREHEAEVIKAYSERMTRFYQAVRDQEAIRISLKTADSDVERARLEGRQEELKGQAKAYFAQAFTLLNTNGLTYQARKNAATATLEANKDIVSKTQFDFYVKNVGPENAKTRYEAYPDALQRK